MVTNMSTVFETVNNINATFNFNASDLINNSIEYSNTQSDYWIGIFIFILLSIALFITINKYKNDFKINNDLQMGLFLLNVCIDVGFVLYQFRILYNIQLVIFVYTCFISLCVFSQIKKDRESLS